jgi:hypothetical protein
LDLFDVRNKLSTGENIYNLPLRVTYYAREGREALALVGSNQLGVRGCDTGDYEGFVYVDSTADRKNDFRHDVPLKF